jgi:hypothetical protein
MIDGLFVTALKYHTSERDIAGEQQIKMTLQNLSESLGGLSKFAKDPAQIRRCQGAVKGLRVAITGQHFEDEHLAPLGDAEPLLQSIGAARLQAKYNLSNLKFQQFVAGSIQ